MDYEQIEQIRQEILRFFAGVMNDEGKPTADRIRAAELAGIVAGVLPCTGE